MDMPSTGMRLEDMASLGLTERPVGARVGSVLNPVGDHKATMKEATKAFEQIMLEMMMRSMRQTVHTSELFGQSLGAEHYIGYLDSMYVEMAVDRGDFGIADTLGRQLGGDAAQGGASTTESKEVNAPKTTDRKPGG